jgi:hypothetical protein
MKHDEDMWRVVWRSLAMTFIDGGYCSLMDVERGAKRRKWNLGLVSKVLKALAVESFNDEGEIYLRLSDKVVPIVPNRQHRRHFASEGNAA